MLLLAFDTSCPTSAVAVARDAQLLSEDHSETVLRHGDVLLPRIQAVLQAGGVALAALELVVVGVGPGSFTGLRIGLATAKGLALASGVALRGVCSMQVLARAVTDQAKPAAVVVDAGKGEVFVAVYERSGEALSCLLTPRLASPDAAARSIAALGLRELVLCGSGARRHASTLTTLLGERTQLCDPALDAPQGRYVAEAGRLAWLADGPSDLASLEPTYLRGADAKLPGTPLAL